MESNGMESNGMKWNGIENGSVSNEFVIMLCYYISPKLKQCPNTFLHFIPEGLRDFFPVFGVTKAFVE